MSPNQDQRVIGTPAGQRVSNIPPRYDQRLDYSLQLANLSVPRLNFVVKGENLGLSDISPALSFGSSSQIPDSAVLRQLNSRHLARTSTFKGPDRLSDNVWHSGVTTNQPPQGPLIMASKDLQRLNVDLGMQALTQQHAVNVDFNLYESSGRNQIGKTEESSGYRPQGLYDPSQLYTVFPSQDQHGPDQASRDDTYTRPSNTVVSDFSVDKPRSGTDPVSSNQNLKRPGSIGRRNTEMVQSRVQNIHVKPPSKFISSGHNCNNKVSLQQANSQIYGSSKYSMSQNTDGSRWTLKKLQEHRDSNTRPESLSKGRGVPTLEQVVHRNQTAATLLTNVFPSWQTHRPTSNEQKRVQSATEIGTGGGEESASTLRNILQPAGTDQRCF